MDTSNATTFVTNSKEKQHLQNNVLKDLRIFENDKKLNKDRVQDYHAES